VGAETPIYGQHHGQRPEAASIAKSDARTTDPVPRQIAREENNDSHKGVGGLLGLPPAQPGSISKDMITRKDKEKFASDLRKFPTYCEARLAKSLKAEGVSFDFNPIIYGFIPDFYFPKARLVVEVDGSVHDLASVQENDKKKDSVFQQGGLLVRRYTNERVLNDLGEVIKEICGIIGHKRVLKKPKGNKRKKNKNGHGKRGWSSYQLDPVRRFNPGPNRTLYQPPAQTKRESFKMRIKSRA
jgi:very-short-patch-repair endonuclease